MHRKWWRPYRNRILFSVTALSIFATLLFGTLFIMQMLPQTLFQTKLFESPLAIKRKSTLDEIKTSLHTRAIDVTSITATSGAFLIVLHGGEEVLFSANKDISSQASSLQSIVSRLTIEGRGFKTIDFRFDKPIIVLQ